MGSSNSHEETYSGPERRHIQMVDCVQATTIAVMKTELESAAELGRETNQIVKELHKRLLLGNGTPAIIPAIERRLDRLENDQVAHDDLIAIVRAFKTGRWIMIMIGLTAAIGFLGILFWHLFEKKGTP